MEQFYLRHRITDEFLYFCDSYDYYLHSLNIDYNNIDVYQFSQEDIYNLLDILDMDLYTFNKIYDIMVVKDDELQMFIYF